MQHQGANRPFDILGITRNTSPSTCHDGEMEELINLRHKDGRLVPINDHEQLAYKDTDGNILASSPSIDYEYIFLHNNNFQHFIGVKDGYLYYFADMDDEGYVTMQSPAVRLMSVNSASSIGVQYTQTGNIVTVLDSGQLKYIYWRKDHYNILTPDYNGGDTDETLNPEGKVLFRLEPKKFSDGNKMIRAVRSAEPMESNDFKAPDKNWETRRAMAQTLALQSRLISRQKGEPTGFFMVCTAIKLYDGNYILQSRPVLIAPPNSRYTRDEYKDKHTFNAVRWFKSSIKSNDSEIQDSDSFAATKTEGDGVTYWEMSDTPETKYNQIVFSGTSVDDMTLQFQDLAKRMLLLSETGVAQVNGSWDTWSHIVHYRDVRTVYHNFEDAACVPDLTAIYGSGNTPTKTKSGTFTGVIDASEGVFTNDIIDKIAKYISAGSIYSTTMGPGWHIYNLWADAILTRLVLFPAQRSSLLSDVFDKGGVNGIKLGDAYYYAVVNNLSTNQLIYPHNRQSALNQHSGGSYMYMFNEPNILQYKITTDIDSSYEDLVDSICVFMTREQDLFNVINDTEQKRNSGTIFSKIARLSLLRGLNQDRPIYAVNESNDYRYGENFSFTQEASEDIIKALHNESNFYLIKEIKLADYKKGDWIDIDLETDATLLNLVDQPTLNLDATDRNSYQPQATLMFNGRLHLANYREDMFKGFPLNYFYDEQCDGNNNYWQQTNHKLYALDENQDDNSEAWIAAGKYVMKMSVTIETKDGDTTVHRYMMPSKNGFLLKKLNPILSYPDTRAKEIAISLQYVDSTPKLKKITCKFPLQPHSTFQFAYYIDPDLKPIDIINGYIPSGEGGSRSEEGVYFPFDINSLDSIPDTTTDSEYIPNGLRVSAVKNPMYFPKENTYKVGNMAVMAMAVNSVQLSEGQAGDCPLFAFAADGIYGFFVDASGELTYTNSRPISRDVCNNWRSITYTDAGVAFTTFRGLFLIGDHQVSLDMSNSAEGAIHDFTESTAEDYLPEGYNALNHAQITQLLPYVCKEDFLDYIKGAIVGYNAHEKELWVSNPDRDYSYVYSLEHSTWFTRTVSCDQYVNNYPETYMLRDNSLTVLGHETQSGNQVAMLSRAVRAQTQEFKNLYRLIMRGLYKLPDSSTATWYLIQALAADLQPNVREIYANYPYSTNITAVANDEELTEVEINPVTPTALHIASDYKTAQFDSVETQVFNYAEFEDRDFKLPQATVTDTITRAFKCYDNATGFLEQDGTTHQGVQNTYILFRVVRRLTFDERPSDYLDDSDNLIATPFTDVSYDNNKGMYELPSDGHLFTLVDNNNNSVDINTSTGGNYARVQYWDNDAQAYVQEEGWTAGVDDDGNYYMEFNHIAAVHTSNVAALNIPTTPAEENVTESLFAVRSKYYGGAINTLYYTNGDTILANMGIRSLASWQENPMPVGEYININVQRSGSGQTQLYDTTYQGYVTADAVVTWDGESTPANFTLESDVVIPESLVVGDNSRWEITDADGVTHAVLITDLNQEISYETLMENINNSTYAPIEESLTIPTAESPYYVITDRQGTQHKVKIVPLGGETVTDEGEDTESFTLSYEELMRNINNSAYDTFNTDTDTITLQNGLVYSVVERKIVDNTATTVAHELFKTKFNGGELAILASELLTSLETYTDNATNDTTLGLYTPTASDMITPSTLSYTQGTPLLITDNTNSGKTYRVYFDESTDIDTLQFLHKAHRKVNLTTFTGDTVTLPSDRNVIFTTIDGTTYTFYNPDYKVWDYEELVEALEADAQASDDDKVFLPLVTELPGTLTMADGEAFRLIVRQDGNVTTYGDYVYSGGGTIAASALLDNIINGIYDSVPTIWGSATYSVPFGVPIRFIDIDSNTYEFRVLRGSSAKSKTLITYDNLVDGLTNGSTLTDIYGDTYQWESVQLTDTSTSYAGLYIWGSYDCRRWMLLGANERSGTFRDLGALVERLDCKYFKFLFAANLMYGSYIDTVDMTCKAQLYEGKIR